MVRVLVVESTVFGYDGITSVVTNYYRYLDNSIIHMDFVTINKVTDIFSAELESKGSRNYVLGYRNHNPFKYLINLTKILKTGEYSILHVHGCSSTMAIEMMAGALAGVKIRIAHSHNTKCDHFIIDKLLRPFFYCFCNVGFACGREAGEWLFKKKNFIIIQNGVDLERFQYNEEVRRNIRTAYHLETKTVIGHVGRFSEQKNHKKLLKIFAKYSMLDNNSILVLIGDGELKGETERYAKERNLNVLFLGLSDEVDKWLQAMDVMVFPSLFEGLPLGLIEAQASGLPCVLSSTISEETKITDFVEFIGLEESDDRWCEAIQYLLHKTDRQLQKDTTIRLIQKANFDIRKNCETLSDLYVSLLNNHVKGK